MARSSVFGVVLSLAALVSCTFTRKAPVACAGRDCLTTFGPGYVCASTGLCAQEPPHARCVKTLPQDLLLRPNNYRDAITIGVLMDRSVDVQLGREQAVQLATEQVDAVGGLDGRHFALVFCDIAEDPKYDALKRADAATTEASYLADVLGVPAIIGPSASADVLAVFDTVKESGVLVMSPAATSPMLTGYDTPHGPPTDDAPGLLWRTAVSDTVQGAAIATHLTERLPDDRNVVVIHDNGPYGTGLKDVFTGAFQKDGRTVKALPFGSSQDRDFAILEAPKSAPKMVLFFSSQTPDAIAFVNAVKVNETGSYKDIGLFVTDSAANIDFLNGVGGASTLFPRLFGSRPAIARGPTFDAFATSFGAKFGGRDASTMAFVPHAYDAAWLVFFGAAWSLSRERAVTATGIATGLRKISGGGPELPVGPVDTWNQVVQAFQAGNPVNVAGASGKLDYDPNTEETSGAIDIWQVGADAKSFSIIETIGTQ